jgi:regulator of sigma E protease
VKAGDLAAIVDGMPVHVGSEVSVRLLGAPDDVHVIGLLGQDGRARVVVFRLEAEKERGREDFKTFGAFPGGGTYSDGETIERSVGVTEALSRAVGETFELIGMTAKSLWMLATLQVSMSSLGGPITIVDLAGQAAERGAKSFVMLMAFISVNLGLVNLLPVPVLDGGHLLMFGIEAVTRQRISAATRERAVKVGFALLMCLVVVSLFNDVLRLL